MVAEGLLTEGQKDQIWDKLGDTTRLHRYYKYIADQTQQRYILCTALLSISASAAATILLSDLPEYISIGLFFFSTVTILWLFSHQYERRNTIAEGTTRELRRLAQEWHRLWLSQDTVTSDYVEEKMLELRHRETLLDASTDTLPTYDGFNRKATKEATAFMNGLLPAEALA